MIRLMLGLFSPIPKATVAITTRKGDSFAKFCMIVSLTLLHAVNMSTDRNRATLGDSTGSTASVPWEVDRNE